MIDSPSGKVPEKYERITAVGDSMLIDSKRNEVMLIGNVRIAEEIAPLELTFSAPAEGSAELLFNLGKITPNPDNAEDTTPTDFVVTIDKRARR